MVNNNKVTSFVNALNGLVDGKEDVANKVTSISSSSTNTHYPTAKAVYDAINGLELGGGGSYINDYYFDDSTKELVIDFTNGGSGGSGSGGGSVDIVTEWEQTLSDDKVPSEKLVKDSLDLKSDSTHTHSQYLTEHQSLTNYVQKSSTTGLLKNDGGVMSGGTGSTNYAIGNHTHSGYLSATKVTSWSSTVSDSNVPSEKLVKNYIDSLVGNIEEDMLS